MKKIWKNIKEQWPPYPNKGSLFVVNDGKIIDTAFFHVDPETKNSWFESWNTQAEITGVKEWAFIEDLLPAP